MEDFDIEQALRDANGGRPPTKRQRAKLARQLRSLATLPAGNHPMAGIKDRMTETADHLSGQAILLD